MQYILTELRGHYSPFKDKIHVTYFQAIYYFNKILDV